MFDYGKRQESLRALALREGIDYFFIAPGANMFYFTGLDLKFSERPTMIVVPAVGEVFAYCPSFETGKVGKVTGIKNFVTYTDEEGPYPTLVRWVKEHNVKPKSVIAMEFLAARLKEYDVLHQALPEMELRDARLLMAELRMAKDEKEIEFMQKAADITDLMMEAMFQAIAPGVKESEIMAVGHKVAKEHGVGSAFMSVASGPKASNPHATTEDRELVEGDMVIIDMGVRYNGYASDITRSFPVGKVSDEMKKIYEIVRLANEAGKKAAVAGVACEEVDRVTRKVIEDAGYGQYFTHRTGHGLGLEVHEEPYIVEGNKTKLALGHVFTVEPGIYMPGVGGVRIEDDVVITKDGNRSLTKYPREFKTK